VCSSDLAEQYQAKEHPPHKYNPVQGINEVLTISELSGNKLECFIKQHNRDGEFHDSDPLFDIKRCYLENSLNNKTQQRSMAVLSFQQK
jgi:hypothetical protein